MQTDSTSGSTTVDEVKALLVEALGLEPARVAAFDASTPLLGDLPELDSLAVVGLLTSIEDRFGISVDDADVDAEAFETVGSLVAFVVAHLG